ncbi:MAG: hypothetical protein KIH01_05975 [Candidatus Freyarchaeota archaeon]|nr:hypothetical protein [Candidatus Jordarchaeia archaeon]
MSGVFGACVFHGSDLCPISVPVDGSGLVDPNRILGFLSTASNWEKVEKANLKRMKFGGEVIVYKHVGDGIFAVGAAEEYQAGDGRLLAEVVFPLGDKLRKDLEGDLAGFEPLMLDGAAIAI